MNFRKSFVSNNRKKRFMQVILGVSLQSCKIACLCGLIYSARWLPVVPAFRSQNWPSPTQNILGLYPPVICVNPRNIVVVRNMSCTNYDK